MLHIVGKKKDGKKVYHARSFSQKAGVVILSDKPDFRAKKFTRDKEEHYIIIKNAPRICNNLKCAHNEWQNLKIHETLIELKG